MNSIVSMREMISLYKPIGDQEIQDQKVILQYIDQFPNILTRDNVYAHMTSSSWILNPSKTKTLMIFHNIYNSWAWTGGHSDGDPNLLKVSFKEAEEETGTKMKILNKEIISLDIVPVWGHFKHGKWVSTHQHLNTTFLLEADDREPLTIKPDENSGVQWVPLEEVFIYSTEPQMHSIYKKLIERSK